MYRGERLIPGTKEALTLLRWRGRKIVFLYYKPLASRDEYAERLTRLGIHTHAVDVVNSSFVLAWWLARNAPGARVFVLGEAPLRAEHEAAGLCLYEDPKLIEYVVAAFDRTLDYRKVNLAFQAIKRGAMFLATNPDATRPTEDGEVPDAGAIIAALEACSGRKVEEVFGKPSQHMAGAALERLRLLSHKCAMVGDHLETDVVMAKEARMIAVLTLTGVTSAELLRESPVRPDYVIPSLTELPALDEQLAERGEHE